MNSGYPYNQQYETPNSTVTSQVKSSSGLCSKKNYFIKTPQDEQYVFMSGTVRPPYRREFEMRGVT